VAGTIYVQRENEGGVLLDLTLPSEPQAVAEYYAPPWFADAVQWRDLLATLDVNRRWLRLYRVGPAASGPPGRIDMRPVRGPRRQRRMHPER
jgi:hypothetical protein